jgi:hypothetical protein
MIPASRSRFVDTALLALFVCLKLTANYWLVHEAYDLHRDEYLHLDQANHLDWGYLSVPPFTSWVAVVIQWLGNDPLWVRFFPALFGALTLVVVWRTVRLLGGGLWACVVAASAFFCSAILRINLLFQPNSFDILCWTSLYWLLVLFVKQQQNRYLWLAACVVALGLFNKYNIVFLVVGLGIALLLTPQRTIFKNSRLYAALGLGVVLILPNLWWQYQHHFPVVWHMKALSQTQLAHINRLDFLKEQVLFFVGSSFVLIAAGWGLVRHEPFRPYRFVGYSFVIVLLLFVYMRAKGYYAIGLYPILLAFGAVYLDAMRLQRWTPPLRVACLLVIWGLFLPFLRIAFPLRSPAVIAQQADRYKDLGLLRWEDGKNHSLPQDFADMLGWRELAQQVEKAYHRSPNPSTTLVLCDNYGQAGAINYYATDQRLRAVTLNADYIGWFGLAVPYQHVILVQSPDDDDPQRNKEKPLFARITLEGRVSSLHARERGTTIYGLYHAKVDIRPLLRADIAAYKAAQGL